MTDTWFEELSEFLRIPSISADTAHTGDVMRAGEWGQWRAGRRVVVVADRRIAGSWIALVVAADDLDRQAAAEQGRTHRPGRRPHGQPHRPSVEAGYVL
jgi:hypothetical protein